MNELEKGLIKISQQRSQIKYTPDQVSAKMDISLSTLRRYISIFGEFFSPESRHTRKRIYIGNDIRLIEKIRDLFELGLTQDDIWEEVNAFCNRGKGGKETGYIYFLRHRKTSTTKIGFTRNVIERQKKLVDDLWTLEHTIKTDMPEELERAMHALFEKKWTYGENFNLSDSDLERVRKIKEFIK